MEVIVTLRFITPCLGDERREVRDMMHRDADGNIVFLQAWWRASLRYAAQAMGRFQGDVDKIQADPVVAGQTGIYRRFYNPTSFKEHEAFLSGTTMTARFCLPNTVAIDDFKELLALAGRYVGISPYGYKKNFGRFDVVSAEPIRRKG